MQPLAFAIQLHGIQGEDNCEERTGRVKKTPCFPTVFCTTVFLSACVCASATTLGKAPGKFFFSLGTEYHRKT
jgi:hypothetical protein